MCSEQVIEILLLRKKKVHYSEDESQFYKIISQKSFSDQYSRCVGSLLDEKGVKKWKPNTVDDKTEPQQNFGSSAPGP